MCAEEISAGRARLSLTRGWADEAARWAQQTELRVDGDLILISDVEHLTLARILTAQHRSDAALILLDRLLQAAESSARMGVVIEILCLRALALPDHGNRTAALKSLERALILVAPEGYVRIFGKRGATSRTQAVARARELQLL